MTDRQHYTLKINPEWPLAKQLGGSDSITLTVDEDGDAWFQITAPWGITPRLAAVAVAEAEVDEAWSIDPEAMRSCGDSTPHLVQAAAWVLDQTDEPRHGPRCHAARERWVDGLINDRDYASSLCRHCRAMLAVDDAEAGQP